MITPAELHREIALGSRAEQTVSDSRLAVSAVVEGYDPRVLVVTGPCSIHDPHAAVDYAHRLRELSAEIDDCLLPVMRVYFEKPRTSLGWKGFINDPCLDGSCDLELGLRTSRELLREILDMGVPCATEALDPILPAYLADAFSWFAIGARTSESQIHREMASDLPAPVGFKNATDGDLSVAINAIICARGRHSRLGVDANGRIAAHSSSGNELGHLVLRGGHRRTNYSAGNVSRANAQMQDAGLEPRIVIDCSHANSRKDHRKQVRVLDDVRRQIERGDQSIIGVMIESHINAGAQALRDPQSLEYGVSITDPCLDWEQTEGALRRLAASVRDARGEVLRNSNRRAA